MILVSHETTGRIRDAFIRRGFDAMSCDLKPTQSPGPHHRGDVYEILTSRRWRLIMAHPSCPKVCVSGNGTYAFGKPRHNERLESARWIENFWDDCRENADYVAFENPVGVLPTLTHMGKPTQSIQPFQFGHNASKETCLWLWGLPKLKPTKLVDPRWVCEQCEKRVSESTTWDGGRPIRWNSCPRCGEYLQPRWANQTDSGQNNLPPTDDRSAIRSQTYPGIADAIGEQWGRVLIHGRPDMLFH